MSAPLRHVKTCTCSLVGMSPPHIRALLFRVPSTSVAKCQEEPLPASGGLRALVARRYGSSLVPAPHGIKLLATKDDGCRLEFTAATSCPPARLRRGSRTSTPARLRRASGEAPGPALRRGSGELVGTRAGRYTSWSVHELVGTRAGGYTSWWVHELVGTRAGRHTFLACLACRAFPSDAGLRRGSRPKHCHSLALGRGPRTRNIFICFLSDAALGRGSRPKHFQSLALGRGPRTRLPAEALSQCSSRARLWDAAPGRTIFTVLLSGAALGRGSRPRHLPSDAAPSRA